MATEDAAKVAEGKTIIEQLGALKYELQHDRQLTPLPDDGGPDIAGYNAELAARGPHTWHGAPWLFAECYLYRRLHTAFARSTHWKAYDVFARSKAAAFRASRRAVLELAARYRAIVTQLREPEAANLDAEQRAAAERVLFNEMCELCLWGNATDLSLLPTALSAADLTHLQGAAAQQVQAKSIVVNHLPEAYETLRRARVDRATARRRVDLVLDNAGFELYGDLLLAGFLLAADLATEVVLHPKDLPWFVSDVVPEDLLALLTALAEPAYFERAMAAEDSASADQAAAEPQPLSEAEAADVAFVFAELSALHRDGRLRVRPNRFWTHGGGFWRLPATAPQLLEDLQLSELVIFKGDLNYRKLVGDVMWPPMTPFAEALGPLGPGSGVRVLALRTCKADVAVGLPASEDERLRATEGGGGDSGQRRWAWSGKWALVQFCDGKAG